MTTTSSSSGPGPAAAPWPATWRPRASASCCWSGATGCPREPQNWSAADVFVDNRYISADTLVRRRRQGLPAPGPLLRRRRHQALRRGPVPAAPGGLRRAEAPRRHLARLADRLRRDGALLHPGRAAVPGPRGARRGPDRAAGERALPVPGRVARAAHPAAVRRPRRRRPPPVPRPLRHHARRGRTRRSAAASAAATCDGFPCLVHAKSDAEVLGVRPALEHPNVTLVTNARAVKLETNDAGTVVTGVEVDHDGTREVFTADLSSSSCGAANSAKLLLASASDAHPNGLANGSDQVGRNYMFHNSQAVLALSREPNPTVFQKTLGVNDFYFGERRLRVPDGQHPDDRQVAGRHVQGREAAGDEARARLRAARRGRARGRLLAVDRGPAGAGEPGHAGARRQRQAELHGRATRPPPAACTTSSSRCSATSACTPTT